MMITENDFSPHLIDTMDEQFKRILVDFCNNFLVVFPNSISKDELLIRINRLKYIGFENKSDVKLSVSGGTDARFNSSDRNIAVALKYSNSEFNTLKSLVYHELIHAISYHKEIDYDTIYKAELYRDGLNREQVDVIIDNKYDAPHSEGEIFDELMTEYYNTLLLKNENINLTQKNIISSDIEQDIVMSHGTGYNNLAELGRIYDYFWGKDLMYAKLHNGNSFRNLFNSTFKDSDIFEHLFPSIPISEYSKFVGERGVFERYRTACKIFVKLLKNKYSNSTFDIKSFLLSDEITCFMDLLIQTKIRGEDDSQAHTNQELYVLLRELEINLIRELSNAKLEQTEFYDKNIDTIIYDTFKKIYSNNQDIKLDDLNYQYFSYNDFKGIILYFNDKKYLLNSEQFGQEYNCVESQKFSQYGFSDEDIQYYSKEYGLDISNAEFFTINTTQGIKTFIISEGQLYSHHGDKIETSSLQRYFIENENQSKAR